MYIEKQKNDDFLDFMDKKIKKSQNVLTKGIWYVRIIKLSNPSYTLKKTLKKLKKVLDKVKRMW